MSASLFELYKKDNVCRKWQARRQNRQAKESSMMEGAQRGLADIETARTHGAVAAIAQLQQQRGPQRTGLSTAKAPQKSG